MYDHLAYREDRIVFRAIRNGILIGMPLGMLVGALIVWAAQLHAGVVPSVAAIVIAGGYGGLMLGIFFGSVGGVAAKCEMLYSDEVEAPTQIAPTVPTPQKHAA